MSEHQFRNGNLARLSHGAYTDRKINPIARELMAAVLEARPDLEEGPATWAWARCEGRILLLEEWLADRAIVDESGKVTDAAKYLDKLERTALQLRTRLGLDPKAEAELANARAQASANVYDLDALRRAGREAMLGRG